MICAGFADALGLRLHIKFERDSRRGAHGRLGADAAVERFVLETNGLPAQR